MSPAMPAIAAAPASGAESRPADRVAAGFARFIADAPARALAPEIRHATSRAFANWLGCALGARDEPMLKPAVQVALAAAGAPQSSVVGRAERLDCVNAALLNGMSANALDYDDMHVPTLIHPTGAVVAAALAVGELRKVSGSVLQNAIATGIEVECRLGLALFPRHYDSGWHITATLGTLGAAAAACVVLGLEESRIAHALGIAATQASGLRAMLPNPCKSFNIGKAAAGGVLAALLADSGLESEPGVFEAKYGLFDVFGWPEDTAAITRELGTRYLTDEISLKPYPCGVVIHPVIDACLALAAARALVPAQIRRITITVHPRTIELAGRQHPDSAITARFSFFHAAALALTQRSAGLAAFDAAVVDDPVLVALRGCMVAVADPHLLSRQARVRVELADGTVCEEAVDHPSGSPARPLTDVQLRAKFVELATRSITATAAENLFDACLQLEQLQDVSALRGYWAA